MSTPAPFTPWYVPGWTAQNAYPNPEDEFPRGPNFLPDSILRLTVTGTYVRVSGWRVSGSVKFTTVAPVLDSLSSTLIIPDSVIGRVKNGKLGRQTREGFIEGVEIPSGFTYKVREFVPGGRKFTCTIPPDFTGTVDINELLTPFEVI